jgi:DNA-binding MarR family transcriptional regulator
MIALRRIVRHLRLADREAESAVGVSAAQLFVVQVLASAPGSSLSEVAEHTLTDQSSVSTVVAKLVDKRLVTRKAAHDDRRRIELRLTAAGESIARGAPRVPQTRIAEAIRAMPLKDRGELVRALEMLAAAMGAGEIAPPMLFEDEMSSQSSPRRSRTRVRR